VIVIPAPDAQGCASVARGMEPGATDRGRGQAPAGIQEFQGFSGPPLSRGRHVQRFLKEDTIMFWKATVWGVLCMAVACLKSIDEVINEIFIMELCSFIL